MKNIIYQFNKWLDSSRYTILIISGFILLSILLANALLFLTDYIILGILSYIILGILAILRSRIQSGNIKFDRKHYNIPSVGEIIVIKKKFFWNGSFLKYIETPPGNKPWFFVINPKDEWKVIEIKELDGDWMIYMLDKSGDQIHIKYFESKKYWQTKSDIRNNILKKLGI
jgi:hypothetical protein